MSEEIEPQPAEFFEPPSVEELAEMLPQYEIQGFIARGGMGAVYLARQPALDRLVAIKVLPPSFGGEMDFAARFQTEARAMAKLQHGNIVSVYDFGITQQGHLYLVMEYVHGETLHEPIQRGEITLQQTLSYAMQLCDALQYAHDHGIIHRDIKPANVLVNSEGRIKVADFGLARPTAAQDQEIMMGTPDYAAPEITAGLPVDHRADIYAFGVLIFEMLTRTTPKAAKKPASAIAAVDKDWDEIVSKATKVRPQDRYAQAKDIRTALSLLANKHNRPGVGGHYTDGSRRHGLEEPKAGFLRTVIIGGALALILGGGFYLWSHRAASASLQGAGATSNTPAGKDNAGQPAPSAAGPAVTSKQPGKANPAEPAPAPVALKLDIPNAQPGHLAGYDQGHLNTINAIAFLPDGRRALSISSDHTMKLWRVETGEQLRVYKANADMVSLAVSSDGRFATVGLDNGRIRLWDIETGQLKGEALSTGKRTVGIGFSSDSHTIFSASNTKDNPVQLWRWEDGTIPTPLTGWSHPVNGLCSLPGGKEFLTVGGSPKAKGETGDLKTEVLVGSVDSKNPVRSLAPFKGMPGRVAVSPDAKRMAVTFGKNISISDLATGRELYRCAGHKLNVDSLAFLDGGRLLLSGSEDKSLRIWDAANGKQLWESTYEDAHASNVFGVSPDETLVVAGGGKKVLKRTHKDDEITPHLWKLPSLASLKSAAPKAGNELANLGATDPALAKLKSEVEADWTERVVKGTASLRTDLDNKYVAALQRSLPSAAPSERDAFLNEISRVSNKGAMPSGPPPGASPVLQKLITTYIEQVGLLGQKGKDLAKTVLQEQQTRFTAEESARQQQGDAAGVSRVKLLWDQWEKSKAKAAGNAGA